MPYQCFDADVLLANIFGSPEYKQDMEIPIQNFIKNYCRYLDNILPGRNFFPISKDTIFDCVEHYNQQYKDLFKWNDESREKLMAKSEILKRDKYNQSYSEDTEEKLKFAADVCLIALKINYKNSGRKP